MVDILNNSRGPFQILFGDDASASAAVVVPIVFVIIIVMLIVVFKILLKDKGRSEMTEEELAADRALVDDRMERQAEYVGETYVPERMRAKEEEEIAEAKRRWGK